MLDLRKLQMQCLHREFSKNTELDGQKKKKNEPCVSPNMKGWCKAYERIERIVTCNESRKKGGKICRRF